MNNEQIFYIGRLLWEGIVFARFDHILEQYLGDNCVAVVNHWLAIVAVPTVHWGCQSFILLRRKDRFSHSTQRHPCLRVLMYASTLLSLFNWFPVRYLSELKWVNKFFFFQEGGRISRVVRRGDPVVGQRLPHVFINHFASRQWTHQVLKFVQLFRINLYFLFVCLHVAEGEKMHKSLRTEVCLVLGRFKVPADDVTILNNTQF